MIVRGRYDLLKSKVVKRKKEFDAFISDWLSIKESFLQTDLTSQKTKDRPSFL